MGRHPSPDIRASVLKSWFAPSLLVVATGLLMLVGWYRYRAALLPLWRPPVGIQPLVFREVTDLGTVEQGRTCTLGIRLLNTVTRAITLLGAETSCGCTTLTNLPLTLQPSQEVAVQVELHTPKAEKRVESTVRLFTDCDQQAAPSFTIVASVVAPKPVRESDSMPHREQPPSQAILH
jgi:hypothetical protein